jgi:hypothetical protein
MRNIMLGLAILTAPILAAGCQRPAEKQAEIRKEKAEEQLDHQKDLTEIRRDEKKPAEQAKEIREEEREHANEMAELNRDEFVARANTELDRIDRNIDALKDRAGKLSGDAKATIEAQIDVLENKYDAVKKDLDTVKDKSDAELGTMKQNFEASLRELEKSYNELAAKVG